MQLLTRCVLLSSLMLGAILVCREGSSSTADVNSLTEANGMRSVAPSLDACITVNWAESPYPMDWQSFIFTDLRCLATLPADATRLSITSKEEMIEWLVCDALNN